MRGIVTLQLFLLLSSCCYFCWTYVPPKIQQRWKDEGYTVEQAIKTIEECAEAGISPEDNELYYAVRFIDRNGHHIYRDMEAKEALGVQARGSWELRLAYEDPESRYFFLFPIFEPLLWPLLWWETIILARALHRIPDFVMWQ